MKVSISLCAVLGDAYAPGGHRSAGGDVEIELRDNTTLHAAIDALELPPEMGWIACVNGKPSPPDTPLVEGDHLYVFLPLSGG